MSASGRDRATENQSFAPGGAAAKAIELMQRALRIIDTFSGAEDVGAHLDLAIHRLREWKDESSPK
jgi:hypothetical protein